VEITYGELYGLRDSLFKILKVEIRAGTGIQLAKLASVLQPEIQLIFEARNKLVEKYGTEIEGVKQVVENGQTWVEFSREVGELFSTRTKIDCNRIKLPSDLVISPEILLELREFVEVEEEEGN
jgi:hypothetical protein